MVASYRYLEVSNPSLQMLGSSPQPVTGLVSRLVFTGLILPHTNLWFQKHLKPTSGQAVMTT